MNENIRTVSALIALLFSVVSAGIAVTWQLATMNSQLTTLIVKQTEQHAMYVTVNARVTTLELWRAAKDVTHPATNSSGVK